MASFTELKSSPCQQSYSVRFPCIWFVFAKLLYFHSNRRFYNVQATGISSWHNFRTCRLEDFIVYILIFLKLCSDVCLDTQRRKLTSRLFTLPWRPSWPSFNASRNVFTQPTTVGDIRPPLVNSALASTACPESGRIPDAKRAQVYLEFVPSSLTSKKARGSEVELL